MKRITERERKVHMCKGYKYLYVYIQSVFTYLCMRMSIYLESKGEVERMILVSVLTDTYIVWQVMNYF